MGLSLLNMVLSCYSLDKNVPTNSKLPEKIPIYFSFVEKGFLCKVISYLKYVLGPSFQCVGLWGSSTQTSYSWDTTGWPTIQLSSDAIYPESIRFHKLRDQSHKTVPYHILALDTSHKPRLSLMFLTHWLLIGN